MSHYLFALPGGPELIILLFFIAGPVVLVALILGLRKKSINPDVPKRGFGAGIALGVFLQLLGIVVALVLDANANRNQYNPRYGLGSLVGMLVSWIVYALVFLLLISV